MLGFSYDFNNLEQERELWICKISSVLFWWAIFCKANRSAGANIRFRWNWSCRLVWVYQNIYKFNAFKLNRQRCYCVRK